MGDRFTQQRNRRTEKGQKSVKGDGHRDPNSQKSPFKKVSVIFPIVLFVTLNISKKIVEF